MELAFLKKFIHNELKARFFGERYRPKAPFLKRKLP